jgi:lipopolysaccharide transport system ATP-binding protein
MSDGRIEFEGVWKKFRRGERHDSLRDLVPALAHRLTRRAPLQDNLRSEEFWAVRDASFSVGPGEALGIIGSNGAGKSTTLKLLSRILKPTRGTCSVTGRVGALIEVAAGFHPDLTGRENVYLQGAIMGMKRAEVARRFDEIVDFAGVATFIDTPVKRYSSGMNARLGFSIAVHLQPHVLLIDEVLSVGDMAFQQKCFRRMLEFKRQGVAIAFVSHNLQAVMQLCNRAILLDRGKVAASGPAVEVLGTYAGGANRETARADAEGASLQARVRGLDGATSVAPGDVVRIEAEIDFHQPVEKATLGMCVHDVATNLYVYGANSHVLGIEPIAGRPGERVRFSLEFVANLTRGLYSIDLEVYDLHRQRVVAALTPLKQFNVSEQVSFDGVANLFLTASLVDAACAV